MTGNNAVVTRSSRTTQQWHGWSIAFERWPHQCSPHNVHLQVWAADNVSVVARQHFAPHSA